MEFLVNIAHSASLLLSSMITFIVDFVSSWGYFGIVFMMFLESSFFPFPSEIVMIPAGFLAHKGEMDIFIVIFCGILGSIAGALFNYYLALKFGRILILKFGKYIFFSEKNMEDMESFFKKHGHISTFSGRLIPVVRQYISLPAGLARMNVPKFALYTGLGAGIWVIILTLLGYYIGENSDLIKIYLRQIGIGLLATIAFVIIIYIFWQKNKSKE